MKGKCEKIGQLNTNGALVNRLVTCDGWNYFDALKFVLQHKVYIYLSIYLSTNIDLFTYLTSSEQNSTFNIPCGFNSAPLSDKLLNTIMILDSFLLNNRFLNGNRLQSISDGAFQTVRYLEIL